jgi:lipopolysaccharide biosynthesis protein
MRFVIILAIQLVAASGAANAQYRSNGKVPPREQLDAMVADTTQAYNNALQRRDFTFFHSWVSTKAQQMFTAEKMLALSKPLTDRKVNLVVLKGRKPTYAREPEIVEEGGMSVLRVKAVYKIKETVTVRLQYVTEKQLWRLLTIDVSL